MRRASSEGPGQDKRPSWAAGRWEGPADTEGTVQAEGPGREGDLGHIRGRHRSQDRHSPAEGEGEVRRPIVHRQKEEEGRHILEEDRRSLGEGQAGEGLGCSQSSTGQIAAWAGYILPAAQIEGRPGCSRSLPRGGWKEGPARTTRSWQRHRHRRPVWSSGLASGSGTRGS